MDTFEDILTKDMDDVVGWAYKMPITNVPKGAELALEALKDRKREDHVRHKAMHMIQALPPHERGKYGPWSTTLVAKIVSALYMISIDDTEHILMRGSALEAIRPALQRLPEFDHVFQKSWVPGKESSC